MQSNDKAAAKILVADDDQAILSSLRILLRSEGFEVQTCSTPAEAEFYVKQQQWDLALLDLNYGMDTTSGKEGMALIAKLRELDEQLPIVVMTGWASIELAVACMQNGAGDFVQKPWENTRLLTTLRNQLQLAGQRRQSARLQEENQLLKKQLQQGSSSQLVAESPLMKRLLEQLLQAAAVDINILILGENGTGKSLLAEYIHQHSARRDGPLIQVNMGAIPENLFESEMFGHVRGAFTDAKQTRIGRFELADGGSLFLDEIGNIPLGQQSKLLRVLEQHSFEKVGAQQTQQVNVRVICATNADLNSMVSQGQFRQDLLYRLNSLVVEIPPLRRRVEDIAPMAALFLKSACARYKKTQLTLSEGAQKTLEQYDWPGNIRELAHCIERAVVLCQGQSIEPEHLQLSPVKALATETMEFEEQSLDDIERQVIKARLSHYQGNMQECARSLGLSRSAFYRRLEKYQL
ncbi:sigma-54 dependent transcriptional regulator [Aliiglaciecola sp. CAU 1673]|uniref:sigma-54-dependent transcriptional regulator n=1 Tax=Aliiglaciecola sp. CAU 1673 TaxID=3032595 RepID=UPI0023DCCCC0|nr:sigma-54 dependent transcriptional regulator [Aliiglaciecola sp. CAU 1673]MDF2177152.1 sigma-54 dependent transcriptional regulator [Aliiglaciecola sp. CAU 1673]